MGMPIFMDGTVQGQVEWSSEQAGLVEGAPTHSRGMELSDLKGQSSPNHSLTLNWFTLGASSGLNPQSHS